MKKLLKILGVALFMFVATVSLAIIEELAKMFPIFGSISLAVWIFLVSWFLIEVRYGKDKNERDI